MSGPLGVSTQPSQPSVTGKGDAAGTPQQRIGGTVSQALQREYPPDPSADAVLDGLIDQLRGLDWPKSEGADASVTAPTKPTGGGVSVAAPTMPTGGRDARH
jgi:hypothetical protein